MVRPQQKCIVHNEIVVKGMKRRYDKHLSCPVLCEWTLLWFLRCKDNDQPLSRPNNLDFCFCRPFCDLTAGPGHFFNSVGSYFFSTSFTLLSNLWMTLTLCGVKDRLFRKTTFFHGQNKDIKLKGEREKCSLGSNLKLETSINKHQKTAIAESASILYIIEAQT